MRRADGKQPSRARNVQDEHDYGIDAHPEELTFRPKNQPARVNARQQNPKPGKIDVARLRIGQDGLAGEQDGKQMWSGLGATYDEEGLMRVLIDEYNRPRDEDDFAWLARHYVQPLNWPKVYLDGVSANDPAQTPVRNDGARDLLELADVLDAQKRPPPAGEKRKASGLRLESGMVLSTTKLTELLLTYGDPTPEKNLGPDKRKLPDDVA